MLIGHLHISSGDIFFRVFVFKLGYLSPVPNAFDVDFDFQVLAALPQLAGPL